jgi:hypothetical protein
MNQVHVFSYIRESYQQLKRVQFVRGRMSYTILKGVNNRS